MIEVHIFELTNKNVNQIHIGFKDEIPTLTSAVFQESNLYNELNFYIQQNNSLIEQVERAIIHTKHSSLEYIKLFPNITSLHLSGSNILQFPILSNLSKLTEVHIDRFKKPTILKNLSTAYKLESLYIGAFTFNSPVCVNSFDEIPKCINLKNLVLSYTKFDEEELKKIISVKSLRSLTIHQKIETSTLAYLAVHLPNVASNELKAWQEDPTNSNRVKINGKRKPYLDKEKDKVKIQKYEREFEMLLEKHAL